MTKSQHTPRIEARVFAEAIPWAQKFRDKIIVIKFGGNAMIDRKLQQSFASDIIWLHTFGIHPVIVHGGGPQITQMLATLNIETRFIDGLRVTTPEVLEVARMVLFGKIGRELVGDINRHGDFAVGASGEDANTIIAKARAPAKGEMTSSLGLVGDVDHINPAYISDLISMGKIPVVSPLGTSENSKVYNINADSVAGALATVLGAEKLVILTDVKGLYDKWPDETSLISQINTAKLRNLLPKLESGMIPKVSACLDAVESGVPEAHIIDGRVYHSTLTEIFTDNGIGTMITP
ncbi:MAG: acetylglutamate kinase [Candidatus Saccharimonas sp.]